jgi:hypothetical protein
MKFGRDSFDRITDSHRGLSFPGHAPLVDSVLEFRLRALRRRWRGLRKIFSQNCDAEKTEKPAAEGRREWSLAMFSDSGASDYRCPPGPEQADNPENHAMKTMLERPADSAGVLYLKTDISPKGAVTCKWQWNVPNRGCGASDVSNFAQTPDGQRRNPNTNRYAQRSVFISTC